MSKTEVTLIAGGIHTGKTTQVAAHFANRANASGLLAPKINGKRHLQNLRTGESRLVEKSSGSLKVGRFQFDQAVMAWAVGFVREQAAQSGIEHIVIDEIGPLEIRQKKGFHELLTQLLLTKKKLYLLVRESLIDELIETYDLQNVRIIAAHQLSPAPLPLHGLVLCGGQSQRMQADKALLTYAGLPQWQRATAFLQPFCSQVFLSVNAAQHGEWAHRADHHIVDSPSFAGHGPMTGIRTVIEQHPQTGLFVLACDYPFVQRQTLFQLFSQRSEKEHGLCFSKNGRIEPMICMLEAPILPHLVNYFSDGGDSMYRFLSQHAVSTIVCPDESLLKNVNTYTAYLECKDLIAKR